MIRLLYVILIYGMEVLYFQVVSQKKVMTLMWFTSELSPPIPHILICFSPEIETFESITPEEFIDMSRNIEEINKIVISNSDTVAFLVAVKNKIN